MRRTLYWKRLLIVAAAVLALGGAVFAVHRAQFKSQITIFKTRAEQAEAEIGGDPAKRADVIALYANYLKFRPTDEAAYRKYAHLLLDQAKAEPGTAERTAAGVEGFLRAFPANTDERRRLAEVYTKGGKFISGKQHIAMLFEAPGGAFGTDVEVREMAAECESGLGDLPKAVAHLKKAIETGRAPVRVYKKALEYNYSNHDDHTRNTTIGTYLVALTEDPRFVNDLRACVAAAQFQRFLGAGYLLDARRNIARALAMPGGADDPETLLAAAEIEVADIKTSADLSARLKTAEDLLRRAHEREPKNVAAAALLAEVLLRQGRRAEGVAALRASAKLLAPADSDYPLVADRLIDLGEQTDSAAMVDVLAADESRKSLVPYFRGRLALLKSDWLTAERLLEDGRARVAGSRTLHKKALVGLAACAAGKGNPDKQFDFCRLALREDPNYPLALVGEGEALARLARVPEALRRYRRIVNEFQLLDYRPELVRLELLDVLVQPVEDERDWSRFEDSLGPVADADARPPEIQILHADSLVIRGKPAAGVELLRKWLARNPKHAKAAAVYVALARLGSGGSAEAALKVLDEAQATVGDSVDLRLFRTALLVGRAKVPEPAEFDALAARAAGFPKPDQFRLWFGLGDTAGRVADLLPDDAPGRALRAAALKYLRTAADLDPADLACRAVLLDHALAAGRTDVVTQTLQEIAKIEGDDGPFGNMGRIAIRLPEVRKMTGDDRKAAVKELRAMAMRVKELRGGWSRVYVALGHLDEMDGLTDAALVNYRAAIDRGERQEFVIRRAVDLYTAKRQDDRAVAMLNKLSTEVRLPDDLERYRVIRDIMLAPVPPKDFRPKVDRVAPADSKDYRLQLLRGALLVTNRDDADALRAFRRAVELNDQSPETWASLVAQLVRVNDLGEAKRAVAQAEAALKKADPATAEARAELRTGLGGLSEMVGDTAAALGHFTAAAEATPLGLNPTRQLIYFLQRSGQQAKADELLLRAKDSSAQDVARWARRHLAITLIGRSNAYAMRGEALALIELNLKGAANDPEDVKARAVIWTVDPLTREDGVKVLQEHAAVGDLTPDEFYLLGRLAFDQGKFGIAEDYFKRAARPRPGVTAEHLAALVRVNLALPNQMGTAEGALERLKVVHPNSWEAVREEGRLLAHKGKQMAALADADGAKRMTDRARALIHKFPGWDAGTNLVTRSGPLFEELGLTTDAEEAYKKYLAASPSPGAHQWLAVLYIRQKQSEKAIELAFEREAKSPPLLTARLLTGAVRTKRPDAATVAKVERWLGVALANAANDPELAAALVGARAELHDARGDYDAAIREYERAIAAFDRVARPLGRKDLEVNNLSMLLALHQPRRAQEAVKMMSEVIAIRGPVPAFLDTRAVAYLVSSRPAEAIKDLELALVQVDRAAYHFHLAWAMDLDPLEAKRVLAAGELEKAKRLGLTAADLHPIELEKYQVLLKKYNLPPD